MKPLKRFAFVRFDFGSIRLRFFNFDLNTININETLVGFQIGLYIFNILPCNGADGGVVYALLINHKQRFLAISL